MKKMISLIFIGMIFLINTSLLGQNTENCFFYDFELKTADIPPSVNAEKTVKPASVTVTIQNDTLGRVSKYIFGKYSLNFIHIFLGTKAQNKI